MKTMLLTALLAGISWAGHATNYYVSAAAGSNSNPGTLARPFATIQQAADVVLPGDTVLVRAGTYTNSCPECGVADVRRAGTPSQWITFRNYPGERPLIKFDGWGGMSMQPGAAYIEVRGLRFQGATASQSLAAAQTQNQSCDGNGGIRPGSFEAKYNGTGLSADGRYADATYGRPHHLRFVGNEVFECGGGGISAIQTDYVTIENNLVYNNCWHTLFGNSGISLYQSWNYDSAPGYHMVVRGNRCFGNRLFVKWFVVCDMYDGNGIILDDGKNTQNGSTLGPYQGRTLVANNVVVGNGGSGIHAFESEHVDIVNNTAYLNSQSTEIDNGEIFAGASNDVLIQNNILVPLPGNKVNIDYQNTNVVTRNNLHFGGTTAAVPGTATVRADPRFVNPTLDWRTADFRLLAGSPALDAGLAAGAPATDFAGTARPQGAGYDLGAFERLVSTPAPVPAAGFSGTYRLLARHSGKALDVSGVSVSDGAGVQQWGYGGGANQQWAIEPTSDGYYKLTAQHSGKCLDVSGVSTADGAGVHQWTYVGGANQQWAIEATSDGYYKLTARHSGKALDVSGVSTADGAGVQQWTYGGGLNQQWKVETVTPATARATALLPTTSAARFGAATLVLYPNPVREQLTVRATFTQAGETTLSLTDGLGRVVRQLPPAPAEAGERTRTLDLRGLPAGLYLLRVQQAGQTYTRKVTVQP